MSSGADDMGQVKSAKYDSSQVSALCNGAVDARFTFALLPVTLFVHSILSASSSGGTRPGQT